MKREEKISYISPALLANLPKNTPVLLAFSGGADSSALLHLLKKDAQTKHFKIHAAHFNHQIRGEEAERDALFCKNMCDALDIPFYLGKENIPELAKKNGNSVEAEAREQRYAFFERIMREHNIPILVTAHHAEDQVESILLHILRGSGITGLRGMRESREFAGDLYLTRPILLAEKQDVLAYCDENGIEFVTDSTNTDTNYARNAIRAEITPQMRKLQPNLCAVFARLAQSAEEADELINAYALEFIEAECICGISLKKFNALPTAARARVLSILFKDFSGATLEHVHVQSIIELCKKAEPHSLICLPQKTFATIENGKLVFQHEDNKKAAEKFKNIPFREGKINIANGIVINVEKNPTEKTNKSQNSIDIKCDLLDNDAYFRSRREGDVIFTGKMNKKAKKLLCEKKIPLNMRNALPILISKNEILWIPSVAVCDRVKTDKIKEGTDFFRITIEFEN